MNKYCNRLNKHRMSTLCLFATTNEENLQIKKSPSSKESDILSSRLKKRFT